MYEIYRSDNDATIAIVDTYGVAEVIAKAVSEYLETECLVDIYIEEEEETKYEVYDDSFDEIGFNPYIGAFDWDC